MSRTPREAAMNANVKPARSAAETALIESFEALRAGGVAPEREAAFARFLDSGLPSRRQEPWHYTDLRTLLKAPARFAPAPLAAPDISVAAFAPGPGRDLVFMAGALVVEPSLPEGVSLQRAPALRAEASVLDEADASIALARAFARETLRIVVSEGVEAGALHLAFRHPQEAAVSAAHVIVSVAAGASLTLLESHESDAEAAHLSQSLIEFEIGEGAKVSHLRVNELGAAASGISTLGVHVGASADFRTLSLTSGARLSRHQAFLRFAGEHATASIAGANLLRGAQHADTTIVVEHVAAGCESRETFKSIVDDDATGVFQGRIVVAPGAQKTDARMSSNTVLLAEGATMNNKPELEIFADDVQCAHGATCGDLDDDLLFYIMARGLPRREAEAMLLEAFVAGAFESVVDEDLREKLMERARAWLAQRKR
jgi:Fe-S cluster assembly protein SufD